MSQWSQMSKRFDEWTSPLRPSIEDVAMFSNQLSTNGKNLLLGVTSELMPMADIAVDNDPAVIQMQPKAILADWADLPFGPTFDAVMGDGCLTAFQGGQDLFFQQMKKVIKPGGRLILRVFISPDTKESLEAVLKDKDKMGFHAFKWRIAHTMAHPMVRIKDLYNVIKPIWDHPTLSIYKDSDLVYYFPKLSLLPIYHHIQFGKSYELSERCPVITWNF